MKTTSKEIDSKTDSKIKTSIMLRYTPAIPTPFELEAKSVEEEALSDHIPILVQTDIAISSTERLTGISWNILTTQSHLYSGLNYGIYKNREIQLTHDKTDEDKRARMTRIIAVLAKLQKSYQACYITLQEHTSEFLKIEDLIKSLGSTWLASSTEKGIVTLYDSTKLSLKVGTDKLIAHNHRYRQGQFTTKNGAQLVIINVHLEHQELAFTTEQFIQDIAREYKDTGQSVIIQGDFNIRFAQPLDCPTWLVTGQAPAIFRKYDQTESNSWILPGADFTDAAIKIDKAGHIEQITTVVLNPNTGKEISPAEIKKTLPMFFAEDNRLKTYEKFKADRKEEGLCFQARELMLPRPCFSLGDRWNKWVVDDKTLAQTSKELLRSTKDIYALCWAVNANNETSILFIVSRDYYKKILGSKLDDIPHFAIAKSETLDTRASYYLFIKPNQFLQLYNVIRDDINKSKTFSPKILTTAGSGSSLFPAPKTPDFKINPHTPSSMPKTLIATMKTLQTMIENGHDTELLRASRKYLSELMTKSLNPVSTLFAKLALANYYLHFNEYSAQKIIRLKQHLEQQPSEIKLTAYLIRPTHFEMALIQYLEISQIAQEQKEIDFSSTEISTILVELKLLYDNIMFSYEKICESLDQQIVIFYYLTQDDEQEFSIITDKDKTKFAAEAKEKSKSFQKKIANIKTSHQQHTLSLGDLPTQKPILGRRLTDELFLNTSELQMQDPKDPRKPKTTCLMM